VTTSDIQHGDTPSSTPSSASPSSITNTVARVAGGGLLLATGGIHLDLYLTGYRYIPTISWMFLLQVAAAFALGLTVLAMGVAGVNARQKTIGGISLQQLVAGSGALFALATLAGYLLSLAVGLFGFKELRTTAGIVAAIIEISAFLLLGWVATAGVPRPAIKGLLLGPLAALAVILLVVGESGAATAGGSTPATSTPSGGSEITVIIKNFAFVPSNPVARPGEKILVKNEDSVAHTFSTKPGAAAADAFTTGAIAPNGSRVVTAPSAAGSYPFLCLIHQFMTGTLTVSGSG
jgi:plastocyanin